MWAALQTNWKLLLLGLGTALVLYGISQVQSWGVWCILFLLLALVGVKHDQTDVPWAKWMPIGFLALLFPYVMYEYGGTFWSLVTAWQTSSLQHVFHWNEWFNSIPLNDASFLWVWQPEWLTIFIGWVYWYGFALSFWTCMIRSFFTKDVMKMLHYAFAGFVLQTPLIVPFYNTIYLQEVWYVQGLPDMLSPWYRTLTESDIGIWTINCFPSMHTSMAFAMLLLAQRENSKMFRWTMTTYCTLIIFSTMYLKIHWVIDVIAGMLFAWGCVKLADLCMWLIRQQRTKRQQRTQQTISS